MIFPACSRLLRILCLFAALPLIVACATPRPAAVDAPAWRDGMAAPSTSLDSKLRDSANARNLVLDGVQQAQPPLDAATLEPEPLAPLLDLTVAPDDLWQRIRNGFGMPDLHNPLVADRQSWYLNRPDGLRRIFERGGRYLYHIVAELEKRGMPTELALLPMVESAYNPQAVSRARAMGMWQFIPSTGKNYDLAQNWWVDERRDILASTDAALRYLQNIYEMHGDWHLALASYNWGENAVARAIARNSALNLPTDYSSLTMPEETRYYVPKLQALKNIVAHPEYFDFHLPPIPNQPYFESVVRPERIDLAVAARLAEMPLDEFIALNPAYRRPVMNGRQAGLLLPTDRIDTFLANLAQYAAENKPLSNWLTYTMKRGDTLAGIAALHKISETRLRQINGITPRVRIRPGLTLLVPRAGAVVNPDKLINALPKETPPRAVKKRTTAKKKPAVKKPATQAKKPAPKKPASKKPVPQKPSQPTK